MHSLFLLTHLYSSGSVENAQLAPSEHHQQLQKAFPRLDLHWTANIRPSTEISGSEGQKQLI